ncbi:MAG: hypothetical protein Q9183_003540 [Haloplaca sp. 2 TL-2023]
MPPIRRYLRITKYSVLECRIYLDNPADAQRWLLNERSPVLPRVIQAVRPLVLPKLREENAKARSGKGGKRKGWKDVVVEEKRAKTEKPRLGNGSRRLTGEGTEETPIQVGETGQPVVLREESQEEKATVLADIPAAEESGRGEPSANDASLFLSDDSDQHSDDAVSQQRRTSGRGKESPTGQDRDEDDKKKLAMSTLYDGFSIYGRVLCLVVKRRGKAKGKELAGGTGQAMMEEWIASTQAPEGQMTDE